MAGYYSLKEFSHQLEAGSYVLKKEAIAPVVEAHSIVAEAEKQAQEILANAQKAYQAEHERGYGDGLAQAEKVALERLLKETGHLDSLLRKMERDVVGIVVACVRKLISSYDDQEKAYAVVHSALRQMRQEKRAQLRVSPGQYKAFKEAISWIIAEFPEIELVDVVEDGTLVPPQIIVESSIGRVEGDFGRRLEELEELIRSSATRSTLEE